MPRNVAITLADDGAQVDLEVGDTLTIRLPENPTTGFRWEIEPLDSAVLELEDDSFDLVSKPSIGSGGTRAFTLRATSLGSSRIQLVHRRAWELERPALQTFSLVVNVGG